MAHLVPRKNKQGVQCWLVQVCATIDGRRQIVSRTSKSPRKRDAIELGHKLEQQLRQGAMLAGKVTMDALFDDLLNDYRTSGKDHPWAERVIGKHLRPAFGKLPPEKVTTPLIRKYTAARLEAGAANGTINRALAVLKHAFNLARRSTPPRVAVTPYIPMLAEAPPRQGFFEVAEYRALRDALPPEIKPVLTMAFYTGTRKEEILSLQWRQVDLLERIITLDAGTTKNGEGRVIPMAPELYETLALLRQERDAYFPSCPWVFHRCGERVRNFRKSWDAACKAAGLWNEETGRPSRIFHDLRRTGVRNLVRSGVPERVAMAISGHKTASVFARYNIVSTSDLKEAARRLGEYVSSASRPQSETKSPTNFNHGPISDAVRPS